MRIKMTTTLFNSFGLMKQNNEYDVSEGLGTQLVGEENAVEAEVVEVPQVNDDWKDEKAALLANPSVEIVKTKTKKHKK